VKNVELIMGIRNLLANQGEVPSTIRDALENTLLHGNPWGRFRDRRADWAKDLGVKGFSEVSDPEFLLWVGCCGSFDARNQKAATSMVKILQACEVRFGILGNEEGCCGDPARRIGNEYLFMTAANPNIETLKRYGVKKILTLCPHCLHILKMNILKGSSKCFIRPNSWPNAWRKENSPSRK
jgi:Fe-S oxidoreductase